ncbi:MAG: hypothetical protein E7079_08185 [Bacteroidales bacterium]|nr:hypothetical protein [Bacteroidales bacterium]
MPYLIDTRFTKWTSEGVVKEKYERRWVVLINEINSFIESLDLSYNELALSSVERDDRGAMSVVTAIYGDSGLSDDFLDKDGELTWWTLSNGVYTYHIKRWVNNDPDAIKAFCVSCQSSYGYDEKEVSVMCNPIAGEPRVMCEATFSRTEEEVSEESGGGSGEEEEDETETEEADGIQVTSSLQEITLDTQKAVAKRLGIEAHDTRFTIAQNVKSGIYVAKKAGELGGYIKEDGWYDATEDNIQGWEKPVYTFQDGWTENDIARVNNLMAGTYTATVPCIHVSISTKKTSEDKIKVSSISGMMSGVGTLSDNISVGGASMSIPENLTKVKDSAGNEYLAKTKWLYEGASFDGNSVQVKTKSKLTTSVDGTPIRELKKCYEGRITHSYRTVTTLNDGCPESTTSQAI